MDMTSVVIRIEMIPVEGTVPLVEVTLAGPVVQALNRFVAENPQCGGIAQLMIGHVQNTLTTPILARYPDEAAALAIADAEKTLQAAKDAAVVAARPVIAEVQP